MIFRSTGTILDFQLLLKKKSISSEINVFCLLLCVVIKIIAVIQYYCFQAFIIDSKFHEIGTFAVRFSETRTQIHIFCGARLSTSIK